MRSDPVELASIYMGDVDLAAALRRRTIALEGPEHLVRGFSRWFGLSPFVGLERPLRN